MCSSDLSTPPIHEEMIMEATARTRMQPFVLLPALPPFSMFRAKARLSPYPRLRGTSPFRERLAIRKLFPMVKMPISLTRYAMLDFIHLTPSSAVPTSPIHGFGEP